jgi:hypothetical protein
MTGLTRISSVRRMLRIGGSVALIAGLAVMSASTSRGQGVVWSTLTIDQALAEGAKTGKVVIFDVHSGHCGSCAQLENDVWQTADGAALVEGTIPVKVDNGGPDGSYLQTRYPVTGLPAVIFVGPDGKEVDRVVGYMKGKQAFLDEALPLKDGIDRLPALEEEYAAHPDSLPLILPLLERRLNRFQDRDADSLVAKVIRLDPANRAAQTEKAINLITRYYMYVRPDPEKSLAYWKMFLDRFPTLSSAGAAVNETYKAMAAKGQTAEWKEYICDIAEKQPQNGQLLAYIAYTAHRAGLTDPRLATAARTARAQGKGRADLDSIAVALEGKSPFPTPGAQKPAGK